MKLYKEYIEDGTSFVKISPSSINPDHLINFALYERLPSEKEGNYRYRCLLTDADSIPRERLVELLKSWDEVYIHKRQKSSYNRHVKDNLEYILKHEDISNKEKTGTLAGISTDLIKEAFDTNFGTRGISAETMRKIEKLVADAIEFISGIHSLDGLADLIGHDYETHSHSVKVGWLTATFINANQDLFDAGSRSELKDLLVKATVSGFLHDIGKIKIPGNILNKRGKLNNLEYVTIQAHTAYSISLLFESNLPRPFLQAILYHHENEDGSGYPCGIQGDEIPVLAKICHIADVFDALTSRRPYKKAKSPYEALSIMTGINPSVDTLRKFEKEARENISVPLTAISKGIENYKLRRLREKEMLEQEAQKRVEARVRLRDRGMSHCFDPDILKRFIVTINKSESFDLTGLL